MMGKENSHHFPSFPPALTACLDCLPACLPRTIARPSHCPPQYNPFSPTPSPSLVRTRGPPKTLLKRRYQLRMSPCHLPVGLAKGCLANHLSSHRNEWGVTGNVFITDSDPGDEVWQLLLSMAFCAGKVHSGGCFR